MDRQRNTSGFTLAELLVAMTIFVTFMAAITFLFVSSLRATRQGYQNMEAIEVARGALSVIERDLSTCFTSRDHGDYYSFYGTPIGMTFVGVARSRSGGDNVSRVTYVLHRSPALPSVQLERDGYVPPPVDGFVPIVVDTYTLIRYVEPGVSDLDTFPVEWDYDFAYDPNNDSITYPLRDVLDDACGFDTTATDLTPEEEELVNAKKREFWILMLGGGGPPISPGGTPYRLPDLWEEVWDKKAPGLDDGKDAADYAVAENIFSNVAPSIPFFDEPFFLYGRFNENTGHPEVQEYWHSDRGPWLSDYTRPRIPELVKTQFKLLFESPYPGAADFEQVFEQVIDVPTAYARGRL